MSELVYHKTSFVFFFFAFLLIDVWRQTTTTGDQPGVCNRNSEVAHGPAYVRVASRITGSTLHTVGYFIVIRGACQFWWQLGCRTRTNDFICLILSHPLKEFYSFCYTQFQQSQPCFRCMLVSGWRQYQKIWNHSFWQALDPQNLPPCQPPIQ